MTKVPILIFYILTTGVSDRRETYREMLPDSVW